MSGFIPCTRRLECKAEHDELIALRAALAERQAAIDELVECKDSYDSAQSEYLCGANVEDEAAEIAFDSARTKLSIAWESTRALAIEEPQPAAKE